MMARVHMHRYGTTREQLARGRGEEPRQRLDEPARAVPGEGDGRAGDGVGPGGRSAAHPGLLADHRRRGGGGPGAGRTGQASSRRGRSSGSAASAHATDTIALHDREDMAWIGSTAKAAELAYKQAGIGPQRPLVLRGARLLHHRRDHGHRGAGVVRPRARAARRPSRARPRSAARSRSTPPAGSSRRDIRSAPRASRRSAKRSCSSAATAGDRQVKDAKRGLTQNMGGTGASTVIHIFDRA